MTAQWDWLWDCAALQYLRSVSETSILYAVIAFSVVIFVWEEYLAIRQRNVLKTVQNVPDDLDGAITQETFEKARLYQLDKSMFESCRNLFEILFNTACLLMFVMPLMWSLSGHTLRWAGLSGEITQSMVFMLYTSVVSTVIGLPWSLYSTFAVEQRHGFNKQTLGFFIKDKLKAFVVNQVISLPIVAMIVYIVQAGGDYFFLYLWAFCFVVLLFLMTIYPEFIAPLFDKYTPLPEGELRDMIEALAAKLHFPLKKLYVVEGSKRSAHSNAYFYGFFNNKRIVLFDTLLQDWESKTADSEGEKKDGAAAGKEADSGDSAGSENKDSAEKETAVKKGCSNLEVVAVLSHELGHWSMNHVFKNIVLIQLNLLLTFAVFAGLYRYAPLYRAFGFTADQPVLCGLVIILQYVFAPYSTLFTVLATGMSRRFEFQADQFGKALGYAALLKAALIKLTSDNLSFPVYDRLYSAWHHSHPPLLQRLAALQKVD
ncbi:CAAX prenyl protease 1 homolog [Amphibalanus amphitrite]|uniref:CAAX prenyl protease 1 homolog n=1 Tax=Amphibalanus amphitrite TaxID=1232801 RepID=UPI001C913D3E|nr:CAAX prenyl protease 1 homolog [Amphibalanus amphitrite]XP_043218077.1 CAAX prenyl protease 1 homolog [Amphibalanus amphitrite]